MRIPYDGVIAMDPTEVIAEEYAGQYPNAILYTMSDQDSVTFVVKTEIEKDLLVARLIFDVHLTITNTIESKDKTLMMIFCDLRRERYDE